MRATAAYDQGSPQSAWQFAPLFFFFSSILSSFFAVAHPWLQSQASRKKKRENDLSSGSKRVFFLCQGRREESEETGWGLVPKAPSGRGGWLAWRDRQWCYVGAFQELGWVPFARPDGSEEVMGAPTRGTSLSWEKENECSYQAWSEQVKRWEMCFTLSPRLHFLHFPYHLTCSLTRLTPCQGNLLTWLHQQATMSLWDSLNKINPA